MAEIIRHYMAEGNQPAVEFVDYKGVHGFALTQGMSDEDLGSWLDDHRRRTDDYFDKCPRWDGPPPRGSLQSLMDAETGDYHDYPPEAPQ